MPVTARTLPAIAILVLLALGCGGGIETGPGDPGVGYDLPDKNDLSGQDVQYGDLQPDAVTDLPWDAADLPADVDATDADLPPADEGVSVPDLVTDEVATDTVTDPATDQVATDTVTDPATDQVATDTAKSDETTATDPVEAGEVTQGGCDPCGVGDVAGMTCAPNGKMAVPYVKVWVDAIDCMGQPIHIQTYSDAKGSYTLKNVPCGTQTIYMQKGSFFHQWQRYIEQGMVTVLSSGEGCFAGTAAKIMVVTGDWDEIENTLKKLYLKYDTVNGKTPSGGGTTSWEAIDFFTDSAKLNSYDIVFINCSDTGKENMWSDGAAISANLKAFVAKGGALYASDYGLPYLTGTWPGYVFGGAWSCGGWTTYPASVADADLASYMSKTQVNIEYGLGPLTCVDGISAETHLFIESTKAISGCSGTEMMFSFQPEGETGGRVIYTTFHNDEQPSTQTDMQTILEYTVFLM
jgi:hypothetical protein